MPSNHPPRREETRIVYNNQVNGDLVCDGTLVVCGNSKFPYHHDHVVMFMGHEPITIRQWFNQSATHADIVLMYLILALVIVFRLDRRPR